MPFGRGFFTAACLILIALACIAIAKRLERERRLLTRLRGAKAFDFEHGVSLDQLSDDGRDTAEALAAAGVLRVERNRCYIRQVELKSFRRKRLRIVLSGATAALLLAVIVAVVILR
jgi:hypothetical protein